MDKKASRELVSEEKIRGQEVLDRITKWMNNVIIRADRTVDEYLDKAIEEARAEKQILEEKEIPCKMVLFVRFIVLNKL